ncbi:nicotinate phosphoribosyltransferase-like [Dendronephthya gigantea]|uniref:nicotinate phosphoribosyltransferase-like n=1 Tax=Dendronephthya gigantea TaxID=151771 RepID=UPI0010690C1D|nr:nicotinate phosphoribosyltransferase-like [Dendronephthya gigantea]
MVYGYWKAGKQNDNATFDLYFRKNPFHGEFTIFAGLQECLHYIENFKITDEDVAYLRTVFPDTTEEEFYTFFKQLNTSEVTVMAVKEGSVVFPKEPLLVISGPLAVTQLMETTLLTLVNYASLVATNAARFRLAAGPGKTLLEFGLRRAQGPNGGLSASKYSYLGGFDGTSNVMAGMLYGVPIKGTHAHSFVSSFNPSEEKQIGKLQPADKSKPPRDFYPETVKWLKKIAPVLKVVQSETNDGERVGFCAYATAFPTSFLALVDTYNVLRSGLPNFCAVALTLYDFGYKALGIRLDSGDLAYLSQEVRKRLKMVAEEFDAPWLKKTTIVASNDINEDTLLSLNQQLSGGWCVFKLIEISGSPRMKLSEDVEKVSIPGKKNLYRLYGHDGKALVDLMTKSREEMPGVGSRILCRHPVLENKRAWVSPSKIEDLYKVYWKDGKIQESIPSISESREHVQQSLDSFRGDHLRVLNPTPYKVSVSDNLYEFMHKLWLESAPIGELS